MTSAPPGLLAARRLLLDHLDMHPGTVDADLDPAEVGIVGNPDHRGGYHCGRDRVDLDDYSVRESPRDRAGLSDFASALDVGWFSVRTQRGTRTLRDMSAWLVGLCQMGDPDTQDIREVIYSLDGVTVRRWDRLRLRTSGDTSHRTHTHISEFRDARGRGMVALLTRWLIHIGLIGDDMAFETADSNRLWNAQQVLDALRSLAPEVTGLLGDSPAGGGKRPNVLAATIRGLESKVSGLTNAVAALADRLGSGGSDLDTASILARIDQRAAEDVLRDQQQAGRIADLERQLDAYRRAEADAARAAADKFAG